MTRENLIEAMARAQLRDGYSLEPSQAPYHYAFALSGAAMHLAALEAARPDLAAVLRGEGVVVPMTDELREQVAIAKMCAPIRPYPGSGGLLFGRNDQMTGADFRDWGAARAFAAIVTAMIAAGEKEMGR